MVPSLFDRSVHLIPSGNIHKPNETKHPHTQLYAMIPVKIVSILTT